MCSHAFHVEICLDDGFVVGVIGFEKTAVPATARRVMPDVLLELEEENDYHRLHWRFAPEDNVEEGGQVRGS